MEWKIAWFVLPFLLFSLFACSQGDELVGSSERQGIYFLQLGSNVLDGENATHADGNTTPINVAFGTEYALWVQCDSNVDVDSLSYYVSPDRSTWTDGEVTLYGCDENTTKYSLTDTGIHWLKFNFDINSSNATGDLAAILAVK